jgi:hypothetical protein
MDAINPPAFPIALKAWIDSHDGRTMLDILAGHIGKQRVHLANAARNQSLEQLRYLAGRLDGMEAVYVSLRALADYRE